MFAGVCLGCCCRCHVVVNGQGGFGWLVSIHFFI